MEGLNIESLDMPEAEILNADPTPEPVVEAKAEPVVETVERQRDPATGQFLAQAPAAMPDPVKAAEVPATIAPVDQPKVIPLAAHIEERRQWQRQIDDKGKELDGLKARIAALEPKAPEPDFIEDPKGYVDAQAQKNAKELEALKSSAAQLEEQQQFSRFMQDVGSMEASFIEKTPDYYDALTHTRAIRAQQLVEIYPTATPEQIKEFQGREELQGAAVLLQQGRNPAEVAYKLAGTYGYRKQEAVKAQAPKIEVPKAPVADPGQTLGSSGGDNESAIDDMGEDHLSPFREALKERFRSGR